MLQKIRWNGPIHFLLRKWNFLFLEQRALPALLRQNERNQYEERRTYKENDVEHYQHSFLPEDSIEMTPFRFKSRCGLTSFPTRIAQNTVLTKLLTKR